MIPEPLRIALLQSHIHWHNPEQNLVHFGQMVQEVQDADLIVLPETFTTGFSMQAHSYAQTEDSPVFEEIYRWAKQQNAAIVGSLFVQNNGKFYNRLFFITPSNERFFYDKKHLFSMAKEHQYYQAGAQQLLVSYKNWKIAPLICYDLRFPVWCRNRLEPDGQTLAYDLLLFVANWPQRRADAWEALLRARAIENLCYTVGLNRVGTDGNGIVYDGRSGVYDFMGAQLVGGKEESIYHITLSHKVLKKHREDFPAHLDADAFALL